MYAAEWWMNYGESAPHLRRIAIRILSQTTSSSSCERNWSSFALVHTKQRNRMSQKKVERNVFIHYNVRLRLKNMKRARHQGQQPDYCPINLDYIFAEDDPLLPWLENREKEIEIVNSEEESYPASNPNFGRQTSQQAHQEQIVEVEEDDSATPTDHASQSGGDDDDDDDDDDSDSGPQPGAGSGGVGGTTETVVPSTYPYPYVSQSQSTTSRDRGKSPIIEGEEDKEDEEEEEELPNRDSLERTSPWPDTNPNEIAQQSLYPYYTQVPQPPQSAVDSYAYLFGYPPQYGYGYGQYTDNTSTNDDSIEEPPRHSFWW